TEPDAATPARRRLRELRGHVQSFWAGRVNCALLDTTGVYQSDTFDGWRDYLRFFPEGTVRFLSSPGEPSELWRQLNRPDDSTPTSRVAYSLHGDVLRFTREGAAPASLRAEWDGLYDRRLTEAVAERFNYMGAEREIAAYQYTLSQEMSRFAY